MLRGCTGGARKRRTVSGAGRHSECPAAVHKRRRLTGAGPPSPSPSPAPDDGNATPPPPPPQAREETAALRRNSDESLVCLDRSISRLEECIGRLEGAVDRLTVLVESQWRRSEGSLTELERRLERRGAAAGHNCQPPEVQQRLIAAGHSQPPEVQQRRVRFRPRPAELQR